jgi:hypothetical protein
MIVFKNEKDKRNITLIFQPLQAIAIEMDSWLRSNYKIDLCITATLSTLAEDQALNRVSSSHREGRAFDVAIRTWSPTVLRSFIEFFNAKYSDLGAVSKTDGIRRFIVHKNHGTGPHLHVQVGKDILSQSDKPKQPKGEPNGKSVRSKRTGKQA